ncbi:hypothetical protein JOB18_034087 [Solea senegalensis]|uniref:Uncharacterized protein n=1 Tax=Solea senegalensis TaxID=28829 RepID=A0AAV6QE08_SOLSE|nr:hypothetical protein JOB18_034087 [Solea senegalensis]
MAKSDVSEITLSAASRHILAHYISLIDSIMFSSITFVQILCSPLVSLTLFDFVILLFCYTLNSPVVLFCTLVITEASTTTGLCYDNLLLCLKQQKTLFSEHSSLSAAAGEMSVVYDYFL